jgi:hypothetical protein
MRFVRWLGRAAILGGCMVFTPLPALACSDPGWQLTANPISCLLLTRSGDFSYEAKNVCPESLHIGKRDSNGTGTSSLDIAPGASGELTLPAPAHEGQTAIYDCTAGTQAGDLRFTFGGGDCDSGCSVATGGRPSGSDLRGTLSVLGAFLSLAAYRRTRRRHTAATAASQ